MDPEITRAARILADHALLLLAIGIAAIGLALAGIIAAAKVALRYQRLLLRIGTWIFAQLRQIPLVGSGFHAARTVVPAKYVALHLTLGLVAIVACMAFVIVAEEVFAGRAVADFDHAFAEALRESASPQWQEVFRNITRLGSVWVLCVASVIIAIALLIQRAYMLAAGWMLAQAGGAVLIVTLKSMFERSRPESVDAMLLESSWSFPSGHAMGTFVFCGLGAYLLLRSARSWIASSLIVAASLIWCLVMGFTRLYLGVHYVSDVVAGLVAAAAWVAVCISGIDLGVRRAGVDRHFDRE